MAPGRRWLTDALERLPRSQGEDRLTEVFAATLESSPRLAAWFVRQALTAHAPASLDVGAYIVSTQVVVGNGRPDMAITVQDAAGATRRILSEHKIKAVDTPAQREQYASRRESDALVAVVPEGYARPEGFERITWFAVATAADAIGRSYGGRHWRDATVSAESRMLAEFVNYLERKDVGVAILDPMTSRDVFTYRHARDSLVKAKTLLEQAARQLDHAVQIEERGSRDPFRSWFAKVPAPKWPFDVEPWITGELLVSAQDNWVRDPLDEPAFAAGYTVQVNRGRWPASLGEATAVRRALEANADITVTDSHERSRGR